MKKMTNENLTTTPSMQEQVAMLGEYLDQHYEFRRNVLSDKFEVRNREEGANFRPITREVINTICMSIRLDGLEISGLKPLLEEYIFSEMTQAHDPVNDFLNSLPAWDGQNHIGRMFDRLPGITTEQMYFMSIWMRSMVAHWMGMDTLHGNECVITLIGEQGCGKSTWCARLLPPSLREYYLDHLNLGNKFDKEMALTSNLLVNIDELDQVRGAQHSVLKQTLSKSKVNGRPIFGKAQEDRRRYASFVATTNNAHPLSDPTGSRRFICINIPKGMSIDNLSPINYEQLYAQILNELKEKDMRYWFTNEEVTRINQLNANHQQVTDLDSMLDICFRHPLKDEHTPLMTSREIIEHLSSTFPNLKKSASLSVKIGLLLKEKNYERKNYGDGRRYLIVPLKVA